MRHVLALDSEAPVGDLQPNVPVDAGRRNADPGARRRVDEGVVEQDTQHLRDPLRVALELDRLRRQLQLDVGSVLRGGRRELRGDLARELPDVGRLGPQLERAGLQPREVQQLGGEVAHAVDLAADLLEELARRVSSSRSSSASSSRNPPSEKIGVRSSCEADGDELLARPVQARELGLHVVERGRELAELVVGVGADRLREVAGGHLARRPLEPLHARDSARATR